MRLDPVNIHAHDKEAVRDFLGALLGLKVGWRPGKTLRRGRRAGRRKDGFPRSRE